LSQTVLPCGNAARSARIAS